MAAGTLSAEVLAAPVLMSMLSVVLVSWPVDHWALMASGLVKRIQ
jgi:hypothetical protein